MSFGQAMGDAIVGLIVFWVVVSLLVGGACGAGCLYGYQKLSGYSIHIEKVEASK